MRIAIIERLVWDIPDGSDIEYIARVYKQVYLRQLGVPLVTPRDGIWMLVHVDDVEVMQIVGGTLVQ